MTVPALDIPTPPPPQRVATAPARPGLRPGARMALYAVTYLPLSTIALAALAALL